MVEKYIVNEIRAELSGSKSRYLVWKAFLREWCLQQESYQIGELLIIE